MQNMKDFSIKLILTKMVLSAIKTISFSWENISVVKARPSVTKNKVKNHQPLNHQL